MSGFVQLILAIDLIWILGMIRTILVYAMSNRNSLTQKTEICLSEHLVVFIVLKYS